MQYEEYNKKYIDICGILDAKKKEYEEKTYTLSRQYADSKYEVAEKIREVKAKFTEEMEKFRAGFLQTEMTLKQQIEDKRQRLINRENEIESLKEELSKTTLDHSSEIEELNSKIVIWNQKETELKEGIVNLHQKITESETKTLEITLKSEAETRNNEHEIKILKERLDESKERYSSDINAAGERIAEWHEKERLLKETIENLSRKITEAENKVVETTLIAETVSRNSENEIKILKKHLEESEEKYSGDISAANERISNLLEKENQLLEDLNNFKHKITEADNKILETSLRAEAISRNKEDEITGLREELNNTKMKLSSELEVANKRMTDWYEKEKNLKESIENMQPVIAEARNRALEATLRSDALNNENQMQAARWKEEVDRINQSYQTEKVFYEQEKSRLNITVDEFREEKRQLQERISYKENQIEKMNQSFEETRKYAQQQIEDKKEEIDRFKEHISRREQEWTIKIEAKEANLGMEYKKKLDEREDHWRGIYSSREEELTAFRKRLEEELEELKRDKLGSDRMWDVRLKEKEDELKHIQLEKAQNESSLTLKMDSYRKELSEYKARYINSREILKEKEAHNRELRARMAQRDVQWKTAYKNKEIEVKRLSFELQQSRRGVIKKIIHSMAGIDKKKKQILDLEIEGEKNTPEVLKK